MINIDTHTTYILTSVGRRMVLEKSLVLCISYDNNIEKHGPNEYLNHLTTCVKRTENVHLLSPSL